MSPFTLRDIAMPAEADPDANRTVLYIEDTDSNLRLVARILAMRPAITLVSARTGLDGLDLARRHLPDLVLLDMHLPDIDGLDVLDALRSAPDTARIPVAALSADATRQRIDSALAAGAVAYITKPLSVNDFLAQIDGLLGQHSPG